MNVWSKEQDELLVQMNTKGLSLKTMAKRLERTENAVRLRAKHIGLKLNIKGRRWTPEEEKMFAENWRDETINNESLVRKHNRTWHALQEKAVSMKLGPRQHNSLFLTIQDVCAEMQVSSDRVYRWIQYGLPTHKGESKRRKYLIDANELLDFLEQHQSWFLATNVSECLFCEEPQWLKDKRAYDKKHDRSKHQIEWTNDEDAELQRMYYKNVSIPDLAQYFHRSESAVRTHLYVIGCEVKRKDTYNQHELDILRKYSDTHTIEELTGMLPGRSAKGIEYKCKMMKIPYHFSKSHCKKSEKFAESENSDQQDDGMFDGAQNYVTGYEEKTYAYAYAVL